MEGHAKKCMERYCELAKKTSQQLFKVATPCLDDHQNKEEELGSAGDLSTVCFRIVLKCLYLERIGGPDILRSANKLARTVTKWTRACDRRLARLISYIHHTNEFEQYCRLFQDSHFAGDLEDSKSTSGRILFIFGSHTLVPTSWMCKKQTSVSHSSTESEIISLDAGLRMVGIPALDLWDLVVEVLHSSSNQVQGHLERVRENLQRNKPSSEHTSTQIKVPTQQNDLEKRRLRVAKQFPDICCQCPTSFESPLKLATENWSQIRGRHERPRYEFVDMGNVLCLLH